jgi:hypothetical protein
MRKVYAYAVSIGVEPSTVIERRSESIVIAATPSSPFTRILRTSELDAGGYYYTTPALAIAAFIVKAEGALVDPKRPGSSHAGWRRELRIAHKRLKEVTP